MIMFLFIENKRIFSGVFLVKYLGEKHKTCELLLQTRASYCKCDNSLR